MRTLIAFKLPKWINKNGPLYFFYVFIFIVIYLTISKVILTLNIKLDFFAKDRAKIRYVKSLDDSLNCLLTKDDTYYTPRITWPEKIGSYKSYCGPFEFYDLQLRPKLLKNAITNEHMYRNKIMEFEENNHNNDEIPANSLLNKYYKLKMKIDLKGGKSEYYEDYPQLINLREVFLNITNGESVNQKPMNDPHRILYRWPTKICSDSNQEHLNMLIIVKNVPSDFAKRKKLRNYYAKEASQVPDFKFKLVFSVGLPHSETGNYYKLPYFDSILKGRAGIVAEKNKKNGRELTARLFKEADKYGDIIVGDYFDSYYNLTEKMITSYRWASVFCNGLVDHYAFTDDDMILQMRNVQSRFNSLTKYDRDHDVGTYVFPGSVVSRPNGDPFENRWAVHEEEYPWSVYPPYPYGITIFLGPKVIDTLAIGSAFVQYHRIDDLFIGILLIKSSFMMKNLKGVSRMKLNEANYEYLLAGHI